MSEDISEIYDDENDGVPPRSITFGGAVESTDEFQALVARVEALEARLNTPNPPKVFPND